MNELINTISAALGVDEETAKHLAQGLEDAALIHYKMSEMADTISISEYRAEITRALNAAEKLNDALKALGNGQCHTLDTNYFAANNSDNSLMMLISEENPERAGIEIIAERLQKTLEYALSETKTPGKGGANKQGKEYIYGIRCLISHFSTHMPHRKLSYAKTSALYKYVEIWVKQSLGQKPTDLRRHIMNAMAD